MPRLISFNHRKFESRGLGEIIFTLKNAGLGPAIIRSYEVRLDGRTVPAEDVAGLESSVQAVLDGRTPKTLAVGHFGKHDAIPKDAERTLLHISIENIDRLSFERVLKALDRFQATIRYESMYGDASAWDLESSTREP